MKRKCFLYWVHRPCHTDIKTEGYIGVTYAPNQRFNRHKSCAKRFPKYVIHKAINKYDDIIYQILCKGSYDYILDLEYQLRKDVCIGWNLGVGGNKPTFNVKRSQELNLKAAKSRTSIPRSTVLLMMIDHFVKGKTLSDISKIYGVSESNAQSHVCGDRIAYPELNTYRERIKSCPNRNLLLESTYNEIMLCRESGCSVNDIALKFNLSYDVIINICSGKHTRVKTFSSYRPYIKKNIEITFDGQTHTIKDWSTITGIPRNIILKRRLDGKPLSEVLGNYKPREEIKLILFNGEQHSCSGWAKILGINRRTLSDRLKHWPIEEAFTKKIRWNPHGNKDKDQQIQYAGELDVTGDYNNG